MCIASLPKGDTSSGPNAAAAAPGPTLMYSTLAASAGSAAASPWREGCTLESGVRAALCPLLLPLTGNLDVDAALPALGQAMQVRRDLQLLCVLHLTACMYIC
jgi:hypothetical protein